MDNSHAMRWPGVEPRRVDKLSRWIFPTLFVVFVLAYWTVYAVLSARYATLQAKI